MPRRITIGFLFALVASAMAHESASTEEASDLLRPLYENAKRAGDKTVVVYTASPQLQPLWDAFSADFPEIQVVTTVIPGGGAPLYSRLAAERASGNFAGDYLNFGVSNLTYLIHEGYLAVFQPPTLDGLDADYRGPDGYFNMPWNNLFTLIYNSNLVRDDKAPNSLAEALQPEWKGKLGFGRYTGAAATDETIATLVYNNAITDQQLLALRDNGQAFPTNAALLSGVAQGRVDLGFWAPVHSTIPIRDDGAPIKIKFLLDSAALVPTADAILKNARHLAAAKLLDAWLYTPRGQAAIGAGAHSRGTMPNAPLPAGWPSTVGYSFKNPPIETRDAVIAKVREKTQAIWGQ